MSHPRATRRATIAALLLVAGVGIACSSAPKTSGTGTNPPATTAAPAKAAAKPAGPATSFGDGTYEVGRDIKAGTYKTTVPGDSSGCYWEREKDLNGDMGSILANDNANPGAHITVTIKVTDKGFKTQDCGTWTRTG